MCRHASDVGIVCWCELYAVGGRSGKFAKAAGTREQEGAEPQDRQETWGAPSTFKVPPSSTLVQMQ